MLVFTHASMMTHTPPRGHAEHAGRLAAVLEALELIEHERRSAPIATREALERVHAPAYIDKLDRAFPREGERCVALDPDTFISDGSREAAYRAAGAVVAAVDAVLGGEDDVAFCAVRPPGHHAEPSAAMGFCLFNNIAVGAMHALEAHGLARVAIVDFDVHHGNGTQAVAEREPRLFFASTHQSPLYPGTGLASEQGCAGNVLNAPLPEGADGQLWRAVMERQVLPALDAFQPELLFISAGFDAHEADPLAGCALQDEDYAWAGKMLRRRALQLCNGKVVSTLEGGYDLAALARSAAAFAGALQCG